MRKVGLTGRADLLGKYKGSYDQKVSPTKVYH